jgi:hypothetical protein
MDDRIVRIFMTYLTLPVRDAYSFPSLTVRVLTSPS